MQYDENEMYNLYKTTEAKSKLNGFITVSAYEVNMAIKRLNDDKNDGNNGLSTNHLRFV